MLYLMVLNIVIELYISSKLNDIIIGVLMLT